MDEDGYAHFSAIENLANRARVTVEEARVAVECFLSPDKNSSDPEHDGRRVERVPGGFLILNAEKHRQTYKRLLQREQVRVRVERHRQKKREINGQTKKSSIIPPNGEPLPKESLEKLTAEMRQAIEDEKNNPVPP